MRSVRRLDFSASRLLGFEASLCCVLVVVFSVLCLSLCIDTRYTQVHGTRYTRVPPSRRTRFCSSCSPSAPFVPSARGFSVLLAAPRRTRIHRKPASTALVITHVRVSRLFFLSHRADTQNGTGWKSCLFSATWHTIRRNPTIFNLPFNKQNFKFFKYHATHPVLFTVSLLRNRLFSCWRIFPIARRT